MYKKLTLIVSVIIFSSSTFVQAEPYIYPANGQSPDQMEKDKYQCYGWGKQQTNGIHLKNKITKKNYSPRKLL